MINHHLSDEMIMAYAAGSLPVGQAMLARCHLDMCPHCQQRLFQAQMVGGALLDDMEETAVASTGFDQLMAELDDPEQDAPIQFEDRKLFANTSLTDNSVPSVLTEVMGHGLDDVKWKMVGPGIRQFVLPLESPEGEKVRLLKLSPGFVTPQHSHHGCEMTLVLRGSFSDESGRYKVGDIQEADDDIDHQPVADTDEDCICLTVTDAPLEFKNVMTRLLQPIVGI